MLDVDTALTALRGRCNEQWLEWALGRGKWPLRINLGAPQGASFDGDVIAAQVWAGSWLAATSEHRVPGVISTESRRALKLGRHALPKYWTIASPEDALSVTPDIAAQYHHAVERLNQAVHLPAVVWDSVEQVPVKAAREIAGFDEADWTNAVAVVAQLAAGAGEAMMVRQLAVPGVHSKWIEQHAALLGLMIGVPTDRTLGSPLTRLIDHIGLTIRETPIYVALRCPQLRASAAGLERLAASASVLNSSSLRPESILIVENLEPGHTITADLAGVAIIHGLGSSAPIVSHLRWIAAASTVLYWGDIDRAGLSILASARRAGIPATALMMDEATLDSYPQFQHATKTQAPTYDIPVGLTAAETVLYSRLNSHHEASGQDLQLEQEHIPISDALSVIVGALSSPVRWIDH